MAGKFNMNVDSIDDYIVCTELERPYISNITIFFVENNKDKEFTFKIYSN